MIKSLMLAGAFLALAVAPLSAQSSLGPQTAEPNSVLVGTMSGSWNTPINGATGFANGIMSLGIPQFAMSANLTLGPSPQGAGIQGKLDGSLKQFPLTPGADVYALVGGTWKYNTATETGTFHALIFTPPLPFPSGIPQILLGQMGGKFQDPYTPFGPDFLGSFEGRWTFNAISILAPRPDPHPYPGPGPDEE